MGTEQVCLIAEVDPEAGRKDDAIRLAILEAGMAVDVSVSKIYLVPPRWLIKSSAGKPSRRANRERILDGMLPGGGGG